jgi:uncharacterized protein YggE
MIIVMMFIQSSIFAQKNFIDQPYIETSASADSLVVPDKIYISITLSEADNKNKKSVEELEQALKETLKRLDIDIEKHLSLADFSSNFKYYLLKGKNILKTKIYTLLVNDAITTAKVFIELENAGISNVSIEHTEYSKAEELILELKFKAVQKSKITAQKLAEPLNQKIGKAIWIADTDTNVASTLQGRVLGITARGIASSKSNAYSPINTEFEKIKFEVYVSVRYTLE